MATTWAWEEAKRMIKYDHDSVGFLPKDFPVHPSGDLVRRVEKFSQSFKRQNKLNLDLCPNRKLVMRSMEVRALRRDVAGCCFKGFLRAFGLAKQHAGRHMEGESFKLPLVSHDTKYMYSSEMRYQYNLCFLSYIPRIEY